MAFRPFSMADSMNAATGAAMNVYRMQDAAQQMQDTQAFRETARMAAQGRPQPPAPMGPPQADAPMSPSAKRLQGMFDVETAPGRYDPEYHAQLLEERGLADKALALRKIARDEKSAAIGARLQAFDFISRAAPLVTDQQSLDVFRSNLERMKLAAPGELPQTFDANTQEILRTLGITAKQQSDMAWKAKEFGQKERQLDETKRHNLASEKTARVKANRDSKQAWEQKRDELVSQGVPKDLATGLATGSVKVVKDAYSQDAKIVDIASGKEVGELKDGQYTSFAHQPKTTKNPTAVNPQTGERLELVNGKWQPIKAK